MARFNDLINCSLDNYEYINLSDIVPHSLSPFLPLSAAQLEHLNLYFLTGNKKEIVVRPREPTEKHPYEHYEALCLYDLVRKQQLLNNDCCQCFVKHTLSEKEAVAEMIKNSLQQIENITLVEKVAAYNILYEATGKQAHLITENCEASFEKIKNLSLLLPEYLPLIESKRLSLQAASQIVTLDKPTQKVIYNYLLTTCKKFTLQTAIVLTRYATEIGCLTNEIIDTLFSSKG